MESTDAEISASFRLDDDEIQELNSLSFKLPVTSLTSGRHNLDQNAHESLNANQYPDILFTMNDAKVTSIEPETYRVEAQGILSIAGVTNEVTIKANANKLATGFHAVEKRR